MTTGNDDSPYRAEALAARHGRETTGQPLRTPARPRASVVLRVLARTLAMIVATGFGMIGRRDRGLQFVPQVEASDCAAACLSTVLAHHGITVPLSEIRKRLDSGRGGASALSVLRVARSFGLVARGVRVELSELGDLPRGTILHWNFDHFVVLDRVVRQGVRVTDPAFGHRDVPMTTVAKSLTGVALVFDGPRVTGAARSEAARRNRWHRVLPMLREPKLLRSIAVAGIVSQALVLSFPFVLRYVFDWVIPNAESASATRLWLFVLPIVLTQVLLLSARAISLSWLRARVDYRLSLAILTTMLSLPYRFLERRATGDLMLRVRSTTALRQVFTTVVLSGIVDGLSALSLFVVVAFLDLRIALVALAIVGIQIAVLVFAWSTQWQLTVAGLEAQAASQARLVEIVSGIQTVKIAGAESDVGDGWAQLLAEETNWEVQRSISSGVTDALLQALRIGAPVVLIVIGAMEVLDGRTGAGSMVAAVTLAVAALTPITMMLSTVFQLAMVRAHLDRINDIFDEPVDPEGRHAPDRVEGSVSVENVSFTYPGATTPVLRDANVSIEPGQCVVVTGASGSGKSTLAMLLSGLRPPEHGRILVDGIDIAEFTHASLRSVVGYVPQAPHFFGSTIRDNVTLFRDYPDDAIRDALAAAYLADDVARLPTGLETILVEGGRSLSGGQLQRLGLARALIGSPRVIILDEATSALDPAAEGEVLDRVLALGVTTIVITHRDSVTARADRVLRVEAARVVEEPVPTKGHA